MKYFLPLLIIALFFSSCFSLRQIKAAMNEPFGAIASPPAPDYNLEKSWAALPNRIDNCDKTPEGFVSELNNAAVDVFWIHPTSYTQKVAVPFCWNADVNDEIVNKKTDDGTMLYQASTMNFAGKIYAPRYRQAHLYSFFTKNKKTKKQALAVAYSDVRRAFEFYLQHYNHGRPIIIASHSQGSLHAYYLLRDYFAHKPLMKQLVAAYVVGMPIPADSLNFILPCADSSQTNCYISWATFKSGFKPINDDEYKVAVCINPLTWTTQEVSADKALNIGSVLFNFNKIIPHLVDAQNHEGLLWVHPPFYLSLFSRRKNYHIGDYNLFYENIRTNAKHRADDFLKQFQK